MTYRLPDPLTNPLDSFVLSYKTLKGIQYDNRGWDQIHWARTKKKAKLILEVFKDLKTCDRFMLDFSAKMESLGYSWTMETLAKHAHEWQLNNQGRKDANGLSARARFFADLTKSRAEGKDQAGGGEVAGEAIHAMFRSHAAAESTGFASVERPTDRGNADSPGPVVEEPHDR